MNLSFQTPLWLVIIFTVISFAVSYFLYRHTVPQVSALRRALLLSLRGSALTLIVLALSEPVFRLNYAEERKPVIALLVDQSLSMSQTDGAGNKAEVLQTILQGNAMHRLADAADVRMFAFAHDVRPLVPESLQLNGGSTDISGALQTSLKTIEGLQGTVLISDGNYNTGANPLYAAEKSRTPIFTVGVGDSTDQKDISVAKLLTNSIGYVDAVLPVDGSVKVSGIMPQTVTVTLLEDGKKIDQQMISVSAPNGVAEFPVQFSYTPKEDGVKKVSLTVSGVEGEITVKNNSRSVLIKILKNKMNIAVVAGAVSADVSAVMQSLRSDKNIEAHLFYQLPNSEFRSPDGKTDLQSSIMKADAVILIGFPGVQTSSQTVDMVEEAVTSRSLPLLFIAGRTVDLRKVRLMESVFPFTVAAERIDEQMVLPSVALKVKGHQLLQGWNSSWDKLPPLFYSLQTYNAKPEAQNLLGITMQNVALTNPLFLIRNIGQIKSAAILGYGINRWKVLAGSAEETKAFFDSWFTALVRWLATREQENYLRIEPSKEFYSQGERVDLMGQVYNESYQPVDGAEVVISLRSLRTNERFETSLSSLGSGLYDGTVEGLPEGDFVYTAAALQEGDTIGTSSGRISVGEQSIEFTETKMNKPLMKQLAAASAGAYADASGWDALVDGILKREEMKSREQLRTSEFDLWNLPSYLVIVILLLAVEWLLRKLNGML
ncbi:MAG: hypothetical protein WCW35_02700 [Bacteroidota bacterium]